MAIVGGTPLAHTNGLFTALAVNALNELVGAVGQPGGVFFTPQFTQPAARDRRHPSISSPRRAGGSQPAGAAAGRRESGVHGAAALKVLKRFEKGRSSSASRSFVDETSALADLILPDHSFLESWVERCPSPGPRGRGQRGRAGDEAAVQTRATGDVLLDVAGKLRRRSACRGRPTTRC